MRIFCGKCHGWFDSYGLYLMHAVETKCFKVPSVAESHPDKP